MEQIRVIKEMRDESRRTNARTIGYVQPRYMVWENVTGAFSSGHPKGADFQAVLQEICKIVCKECPPIPIPKEGWHYAGSIDGVGDDGTPFSISWRTHDAQYWGKPSEIAIQEMLLRWGHRSVAEESRLSQILEDCPHPHYNLSAKASAGILRRAEARKKELPELLKTTLEKQAKELCPSKNEQAKMGG